MNLPRHLAIIMDGNGRWAKARRHNRVYGHLRGARVAKNVIEECARLKLSHLTLFAFSTENWRRPQEEVSSLMGLLALYLQKEVKDMNTKGVRLRVIGDTSRFDKRIQALIRDAEANTAHNDTINLTIAANYGGRQDIISGVKAWQAANPALSIDSLDEENLRPYLSLRGAPEPDLLIRTGGESRVSNFMLWQMAYTEMFFTDVLWPGFNAKVLDEAIDWFGSRDRRFGSSSPELAEAVVRQLRAAR